MIGILDSGGGGINVINECLKYYNEDFVYLVDNANCPYGNKPISYIQKITQNNLKFLTENFDLDFIIIACNTASGAIGICDEWGLPILKTKPNLDELKNVEVKTILFATKNTIKHSDKINFYKQNYDNLICVSIKNLPKLIDNYLSDKNDKNKGKIIKTLKKRFFCGKKLKNKYKNVQFLSLGCTHFKHIIPLLGEIFKNVTFLECESDVAKISRFLVRKTKDKSRLMVVLTKKDEALKKAIEEKFCYNCVDYFP